MRSNRKGAAGMTYAEFRAAYPPIAGADPAHDVLTDLRRGIHEAEAAAWSRDTESARAMREHVRRARQILDRCDDANRVPRPDEITQLGEHVRRAREAAGGDPLGRHGYQPGDGDADPDRATPTRRQPVLQRGERMEEWLRARGASRYTPQEVADFSLGRALQLMVCRDLADSDWSDRRDGELELRALSEGTDSAGGFTTPELLSATAIDRIRKAARVIDAGATIVPCGSDNVSIPRMATGITPAWKSENTAVTNNEPTFERVTFKPKTLPHLVKLSFELFEDMTDASAQIIETELLEALALELDRAALLGSGVDPEPKGIINQTGVEIQTPFGANGGTPANFDFMVDAVAGVRLDNIEPNAMIYSARTDKTLGKLKDTTNQPLQRPKSLENVRELVSNQVPDTATLGTSTDTSHLFAGDFTQLMIGVRPSIGVRVKLLGERYMGDSLSVGLLAWLRADIQLAHPEGFVVAKGIRP